MVIVWRHDLKEIPLGKKFAQVAHAAHLFLNEKIKRAAGQLEGGPGAPAVTVQLSAAEWDWISGNFRKVAVLVRSEDELMVIFNKAKELGLPVELVTDDGLTVFQGPTRTCLAIGPAESAEIDRVTGDGGPLGKLRLV
jgi:peptidyl-tRNA hydrolase